MNKETYDCTADHLPPLQSFSFLLSVVRFLYPFVPSFFMLPGLFIVFIRVPVLIPIICIFVLIPILGGFVYISIIPGFFFRFGFGFCLLFLFCFCSRFLFPFWGLVFLFFPRICCVVFICQVLFIEFHVLCFEFFVRKHLKNCIQLRYIIQDSLGIRFLTLVKVNT